jgi:hypothetical protein
MRCACTFAHVEPIVFGANGQRPITNEIVWLTTRCAAAQMPGSSVIQVRVNGKFAFCEFRSVEECNLGLVRVLEAPLPPPPLPSPFLPRHPGGALPFLPSFLPR